MSILTNYEYRRSLQLRKGAKRQSGDIEVREADMVNPTFDNPSSNRTGSEVISNPKRRGRPSSKSKL